MAKPTKDRVPLTATWNAIKQANPTLTKSPLFKPDIMVPIGSYDKCLLNYTKQLTDKDKLLDLIKEMDKARGINADQIKKHQEERDRIDAQGNAKMKQFATELDGFKNNPEADSKAVGNAMVNYTSAFDEVGGLHKALTDRVSSLVQQQIAKLKTISTEYRTKSAAISAAMNKLDSEVLALEGQIRGIISKYQQIAVQIDHDDLGNAVKELLAKF